MEVQLGRVQVLPSLISEQKTNVIFGVNRGCPNNAINADPKKLRWKIKGVESKGSE
jgi:hypothetical protein